MLRGEGGSIRSNRRGWEAKIRGKWIPSRVSEESDSQRRLTLLQRYLFARAQGGLPYPGRRRGELAAADF